MARAFPPDVLVLDTDSLLHARLGRGNGNPQILQAKSYRVPEGTFIPAVVTPELADPAALADVVRRLRLETGRWDKASLLLPDSWFRINILELPTLPDRRGEANDVVRWSLKRTMPIEPDLLRVAWETLSKAASGAKVLSISGIEKPLAGIEKVFADAGVEIVLIEPIGLNIWNAIAVREAATSNDRLFFYLRERDFTTAVFRGTQPLFIRSRNLNGERTLEQEIKLSASYLRDTLRAAEIENCYVAGNRVDRETAEAISSEFGSPVRMVSLREMADQVPGDTLGREAELTACTGVFTG
jgi:type IV pilus assembly protein PilM